jgi:hypothetical protein
MQGRALDGRWTLLVEGRTASQEILRQTVQGVRAGQPESFRGRPSWLPMAHCSGGGEGQRRGHLRLSQLRFAFRERL